MPKKNQDFNYRIGVISRFIGTPLVRTGEVDYTDTYTDESGTLQSGNEVDDGFSLEDPSASDPNAGVDFEITEDGGAGPALDYDTTGAEDEITVDMDYIDEFEEYYTDDPCEAYMASDGEGSFGITG